MACGCKKKGAKQAPLQAQVLTANSYTLEGGNTSMFANKPGFIECTFVASGTHSRTVPLPTPTLLNEYGLKSYGVLRPGATIWVHENDVKARPKMFVPVDVKARPKMLVPLDVKAPMFTGVIDTASPDGDTTVVIRAGVDGNDNIYVDSDNPLQPFFDNTPTVAESLESDHINSGINRLELSPEMTEALHENGFRTIQIIADSEPEALTVVKGIGMKTATRIVEDAKGLL